VTSAHPPTQDPPASEPSSVPSRRRRRATIAGTVLLGALIIAFLAQAPPLERVPHFVEHHPSVIAHAGAQGHAPPNTMEAFALALELGADVLEMDTQITADGEVVTHHDGTVDRQTDGAGAIADLTLAELRELDAGHGFIAEDGTDWTGAGTQIPTLDEVLEAFPDTFMIVELKLDGGPAIIEPVAERIEAAGAQERVVVASFDVGYLRTFRERMPGVPTNMAEDETRAFYIRHLVGAHRWWSPPGELFQVPEYHEDMHVVTPRFVGAADRIGVDVHVWTVNETDDMRRLIDLGVHGIITDYPDRLVALLEELPSPPAAGNRLHELGLDLTRWSQETLDWLTPILLAVTHLGDAEFYLLVFPLLYWSVSRRLGLRMGIMLLLSASINAIGKLGFTSPRPFFLDPEVGRITEASFGIPSGHAQNGIAVWGLLAYDLRRRWAYSAAAVLILALGWSRIHLGAHFPEDLLVGWAVGGLLLVGFIRLADPVTRWLAARSPAQIVGLAFGASLALIATAAVVRLGVTGWEFPSAWIGAGEEGLEEGATGLGDAVTRASALFGLVVGVVLVRLTGGFESAGTVAARIGRYLLGLVGVIILWQGLGAIFPSGESAVALVLRYVRYAAIGVWIGGVAPLLFVRIGLAPAGMEEGGERAEGAQGAEAGDRAGLP
jgi:glycerophosphoryl diester phosphodiesterase/membrane-associated phospholipid phosphatase